MENAVFAFNFYYCIRVTQWRILRPKLLKKWKNLEIDWRGGCQRIRHTAGESGGELGSGDWGGYSRGDWGWGQIGCSTQTPDPNPPNPNLPTPPTSPADPNHKPPDPKTPTPITNPNPPDLNLPNPNPPDPNLTPLCGESSTSALLQTFVRRLRSNSRSHMYVSPIVWRIFHVANPLATGEVGG